MESSDCIVEGLFLGGIMAALNEKDLNDKSMTHILSIDENPLPPILTQRFNYKHVYALDMYDTDLLSYFADTFVFIEQAKNAGGNVLVHCQAGMSRSATIVAAYLMQKMGIGREKALDIIKSSRPFIRPNEGFMEQLDLFETMGCELIKTHRQYRSYRLSKLADKFQQGHISGDNEIPADLFLQSDFAVESNDAYYKCRKCRMILFRQGAVTNHAPGMGDSAFDWRGKGPAKQHHLSNMSDDQETCSRSLFVDPLLWMKGKVNVVSGKLHCPKCDIKLGSFVWYGAEGSDNESDLEDDILVEMDKGGDLEMKGEKCPCGAWVAPAFHIDSGKVDKIPFHSVAPQAHVVATGATASPSLGRPMSSYSDFAQRRPLSQGPGFSAGHRGTSQNPSGKPVAMVAAVTPRVASQDAPSTSASSSTNSGMEIDELSLAVGTSSLESTAAHSEYADVSGRQDGNVCMDVDS